MSEDVEARPTAASATGASTTAAPTTPASTTASDRSAAPATASAEIRHDQAPAEVRYHHGASPAGWAGAIPALVGVFIAAIGGTVPHFHPVIFAIGAILFVLGGITAVVLRALGFGND